MKRSRSMSRTAKRFQSFYWGSGLSDDVPALAWYLVSACAPLSLGIAAIAAIVLGDAARAEAVAARIAKVLPPGARDQVLQLVLRTRHGSPLLLAISVIAMVWVSANATGVIERVESRLLPAPRAGMVPLKLRHLTLAAAMVFLIAAMAIAATQATSLRHHLWPDMPGWIVWIPWLVVIAAVCALLYRFATQRRLAWRAALTGGLLAALFVELTPLLAGYYARAVAGRTPVQVFLVLAGLLFACYIVAQGLLIGAGVAVSVQHASERRSPVSEDVTAGGPR
jgi:uncharacterized BrkB/YihY/UPF0761 family membrane protein